MSDDLVALVSRLQCGVATYDDMADAADLIGETVLLVPYPAAEITRLRARVAELEGALKEAATSVGEWGAYASQYLQDKWDLPGEVARYIAIAEGKNDAAKEGKKDE